MKINIKKIIQLILYIFASMLAENKMQIVDHVSTVLEATASNHHANPSLPGNEGTLNNYGAQAPQPLSSL